MNKSKNEKISESMKGNTNALKWDYDKSKKLMDDALKLCDEKEDYTVQGRKVKGYKFDFIGELARELKVYREVLTIVIPNAHNDLEESLKQIKTILESNCYSNTKKGIINTAVGIVNLKSNHKWTDRIDNTSKDEVVTNTIINLGSGKKPY